MFLLHLLFIIKQLQINGQAIVSDQCQSQTSTANDLVTKFRQLETEYASLRQQYMHSQNRLIEMEGRQKKLEDELREVKDQVNRTELLKETDGK